MSVVGSYFLGFMYIRLTSLQTEVKQSVIENSHLFNDFEKLHGVRPTM